MDIITEWFWFRLFFARFIKYLNMYIMWRVIFLSVKLESWKHVITKGCGWSPHTCEIKPPDSFTSQNPFFFLLFLKFSNIATTLRISCAGWRDVYYTVSLPVIKLDDDTLTLLKSRLACCRVHINSAYDVCTNHARLAYSACHVPSRETLCDWRHHGAIYNRHVAMWRHCDKCAYT